MLVDDDYPVLELLSLSIPWTELGLRLVGLCENGNHALTMAETEMPDILITDIGMPLMDGIELIRLLKERNPKLQTVVLSCHNEFQYAQQAVKLNVMEYILKETMKPQQIIQLLQRICEELGSERTLLLEHEHLKQMAIQNRSSLKEQFIRATLNQPILNSKEWYNKALSFGINLEHGFYMPVLCCMDRYTDMKNKFKSDDMLLFAVENIIDEIMDSHGMGASFHYNAKEIYLWFPYESTVKVNSFDLIHMILKQLQGSLQQYLKMSASFIMGSPCKELGQMKQQLVELSHTANPRFYLDEGSIVKLGSLSEPFVTNDIYIHYSNAIDQIRQTITDENESGIHEVIAQWIGLLISSRYHPEVVKEWVHKIFLDLEIKFKTMRHFYSTYSAEKLHRDIYDMGSIYQMQEWMVQRVVEASARNLQINDQSKKKEILETQRFVQMNLDKRITLELIANHLHLSESYFSRMYKKETNETFIEYVTRAKMERAKELLNQSSKTIEDIATMLGYDDKRYFTRIFKEYTGMKPGEYGRELHGL
jgi:two-component system response regulator YesN